ncbi:MAG TPA: hypothetical protein PLE37_05215 [Pseudomonadota bacterium]|nr:hypothetical protein [Pseudomonadota bacterium]
MRALTKSLYVVLAGVLLASCGGGGGGDSSGAFTPNGLKVTVQPASTSSTPNSLVGITVRVNNTNDTPVGDGVQVTLQVSPPGVGLVSTTTPTPNIGERAVASTAGGIATFRLHTRSLGTATLTASVPDTRGPGTTVTATANVAVNAGAPNDPRISIQATATTLPINPGIGPFFGSPYIADVTLTQRSLDGALVSTGEEQFGVSINPVTFAAFSTLDDGETEDINEFEVLLGNGPVDAAGGRATVFVHSFNRAAQVVLTVTAQDPQTGETVSGQQTFTIASGATGLPGSVVIDSGNEAVYIQGVNGATSKSVEVFVIDAAGGFAQSPAAGVNNIQLEIVGGAQGGERLQSIGANGQSQSGSLVRFASNNGVGNATYASGTRSGPLTLRATSDRADNNVDNGIQDGVTSTRALSVSDGQLFDLDIASPANVVASTAVSQSPTSAQAYEMDVAIVATDRFGNPVPPGTEIRFGLIDEPQSNGAFLIAGGDGNPQENGTTFTAPGGAFTTAAGGVGPNDTLVVFGEERPQDRDLENIRTVQQVVNATTLTVQNRFNRNDDTGTSVDNGPVLPYVIGRAVDGNVRPTASTDSSGVARVTVTYPISKLGKRMVLWAQANATPVSTPGETAGDAEVLRFQAAGPLEISAPTGVQGNRTVGVPVCLEDAFGNGVGGVRIGYVVSLTQGSASIDGSAAAAGTLATVTGFDGCAIASVTTSGITQAGTAGTITWQVDDAEAETDILGPASLALIANPGSFLLPGGQGSVAVSLTLSDGSVNGVGGVLISATCTATGAQASLGPSAILPTGPNGSTVATIQYGGFVFDPDGAGPLAVQLGTGTCTFRAGADGPTAVVTFSGSRICGDGFSPPPAGCVP